ncbi:DUF2157 domain-containing protein [Candidatus Woesearchaeota archaeon]|nr:DUF2157 domain-containing protein [Candidatus Woesearchaeota archaeon]
MFKSKKAATFGTIVAVFGTVLIALGFAWLIAQNWHQINKWVKIVILIAVTGASFFSGTFFRIRKHEGIGKSLHALGALFYTLTLFLIAQIFSFEASLQGTAWLLLMSWAGVGFTAYALNSSFNLAISLAEFLGWLVAQFLAFSERFEEFRPGVLAFALLFVAIILFGLYLFHKSKNHLFARAYQFWTAFYILAFTYVLSFQSLLPSMWPKGVLSAPSQIWFPSAFLLLSIIFGILGISSAIRKKVSQTKEIAGFGAIVAILAILIGSTSFTSDIVGKCYTKSCYNYGDEENCSRDQPKQPGMRMEWECLHSGGRALHALKQGQGAMPQIC